MSIAAVRSLLLQWCMPILTTAGCSGQHCGERRAWKPPRLSRKDLKSALALSRLAMASCESVRLNVRRHGSRKAAFWSPNTRLLMKMSFWKVCKHPVENDQQRCLNG